MDIKSISELNDLVNSQENLFIRWSRGIEFDKKQCVSRDFAAGCAHSGLSAVKLNKDWSEAELASRVSEYSFLRIKDGRISAWIYKGNEVGNDSDAASSITEVELVGTLSSGLIKQLDSGLARKMALTAALEEAKSKLQKVTDDLAREVWRDRVKNLEKELLAI